jgi:hypothetical protein
LKRLRFTIEDAHLVDENPNSNFAVLDLDFFASGKNLHDTYVSPETLMSMSGSIRNCPLVWTYDPMTDDIFTHNKNQVPCGFVPESTDIRTKVLGDGRTMLSTIAYVWKKYSGEFLSFFKRDGDKPVSVEMSVYDSEDRPDGLTELTNYRFEAITVLGSLITPAIPDAKASVLSFAKEYEDIYKREFSLNKYESIDFTIPTEVKKSVKLALSKDETKKATSIVLSIARHLMNNEKVSPEKARYIEKNIVKKSLNPNVFALLGGKHAVTWSKDLVEKMQKIDFDAVAYYSTMKEEIAVAENSPAEKPVGLEVMDKDITSKGESRMGKTKEELMAEEAKVKEEMAKEGSPAEEKAESPDEAKAEGDKEEMAKEETPAEEKKETPAEEKKEPAAEEKKEKMSEEKEFDFAKMRSFFESDEKMGAEVGNFEQGMYAEAKGIIYGMFAKMCNMAEELKACKAEMSDLVAYKASKEEAEKAFAVDMTIKKLEEKVVIPDEARAEMVAKAKEFATIEEFEIYAKAKSFDFAVIKKGDKDVMRVEAPKFGTGLYGSTSRDDIWASK